MALELWRRQNRRGKYSDMNVAEILEGEFTVVTSGDPNNVDGQGVYVCYKSGDVKRLANFEDLQVLKEKVDEEFDKKMNVIEKNLDKTLTKDGGYADAKVVGDTFKKIGDGSFFVDYNEETGDLIMKSGSFLVDYDERAGDLMIQSTGLLTK